MMRGEIQRYLEHFTHFIAPGSVRIGFSRYTDKIERTAFQTGESIVVVFLNRTDEALPAYLRLHDQCVKIVITPAAFLLAELRIEENRDCTALLFAAHRVVHP